MKEQNIAQNKKQVKEQAFLLYDTRSNSIVICIQVYIESCYMQHNYILIT